MYVYTLEDPRNGEIKYVGITCRDLQTRLNEHISVSRNRYNHKTASWIKSLIKQGLKPIISVLEHTSIDKWKDDEKYWIAQFKTWGVDLKNHSLGGEGNLGLKHSEETKRKISEINKGRKAWNKGKKQCFSKEWSLQQSLLQKGKKKKPKTQEQKNNCAISAIKNRGIKLEVEDTLANNTLKFNSISECAKYLNTSDQVIRIFLKRGTKIYKKQYKINKICNLV